MPNFLFLSEPWIDQSQILVAFWKGLHLKPFVVNNRTQLLPNIWGFCEESIFPTVISVSSQFVAFSVIWEDDTIYTAAIYASTSYIVRRKVLLNLAKLQEDYQGPWCFIGDYNAILGSHEKRGAMLLYKSLAMNLRYGLILMVYVLLSLEVMKLSSPTKEGQKLLLRDVRTELFVMIVGCLSGILQHAALWLEVRQTTILYF